MQMEGFKRWILLYPFMIGIFAFWAFLSFLLEFFIPTLPVEDQHFTIPILIIAAITVTLSMTRLRQIVERFTARVFDIKLPEETNESKSHE
jgi:hypothetical protein